MKGLLAVVDVDARNVGMSRLVHVINNGGKRARGDALIRMAWHASATRAVAEQNTSADTISDRDGVVEGFTVEGHLSSVLALRRQGEVWWGNVDDMRLHNEGQDNLRASLRLLAAICLADRALIGGTVVA